MKHPGDRTLEKYRSRSLTHEQAVKVARHLQVCPHCASRLEQWKVLDGILSEAELDAPSLKFADRVLEGLTQPLPLADKKPAGGDDAVRQTPPRRSRLRPELTNALVAMAATYVFVSSGFIGAVFYVAPNVVEARLYTGIQTVAEWVDQLSQALF